MTLKIFHPPLLCCSLSLVKSWLGTDTPQSGDLRILTMCGFLLWSPLAAKEASVTMGERELH